MAKTVPFFIFLLIAAAFIAGCTPISLPVSSRVNTVESAARVETQPASIPSATGSVTAEELETPVPPSDNPAGITPPQFLLFYVSQKTFGAEVSDLRIARFNGEEIEVLSEHKDLGGMIHPVWSPDGSMIAFTDCGSARTPLESDILRILNRDGTETIHLENVFQMVDAWPDCYFPVSWSPDSKNIAFVGTVNEYWRDIFVLSIERKTLENITKDLTMQFEIHSRCIGIDPTFVDQCQTEMAREHSPYWSPDGSMIAMTAGNDIYTVSVDGNKLRKITDSAVSLSVVSWTPDNKQIIYTSDEDTAIAFYTVSVETGSVQQLGEGEQPALSPDGAQIAFTGKYGGIYVMDLDGKNLNKIDSSYSFEPHWTPDGDFVISRHSTNTISIISKDGGWRKKLGFNESDEIWKFALEGE